jgi:hypothetical protein
MQSPSALTVDCISDLEPKRSTPEAQGAYDLSFNSLQNLLTYAKMFSGLSLRSKVNLPAGAHFCNITVHTPQPSATWRTIQTSETTHTEISSALLDLNHSCDPSLEIHVNVPDDQGKYPGGIAAEVKVERNKDLRAGDELTFFYPSTEWEFDRAFECSCGASKDLCIGMLTGARDIKVEVLERYWVCGHIWRLKNVQQ